MSRSSTHRLRQDRLAKSGALTAATVARWMAGAAVLGLVVAAQAQEPSPSPLRCSGYSKCPEIDYFYLLQNSRDARNVATEDNAIEARALTRFRRGNLSSTEALRLLGELAIYDPNLSVDRNEPCASCHTQQAGFTGGIGVVNHADVAFPGSTGERSSKRKPMSYAYAPFAPVLHFRASTGDFVGGNFWDMRATGLVTGNPAGDQALGPPVGPVEMDSPDPACVIYRVATGPYRGLFQQVWGDRSLEIAWPANVEKLCDTPLSDNSTNPRILPLDPADRHRAATDYNDMGMSAAAFEAGPQVSAFSSKFDAWQDGFAQLTPQEMRGFQLFTGRANCSQCHTASGQQPLFTDFTAVNLGVPRSPGLPFLHENRPDIFGYVANPVGPAEVDNGVGAFLASSTNTNAAWKQLAPKFNGTFQVATARNVDRRPYPSFRKAYMHNGYFKSLKEVVHFYNTRDVLARCKGDPEIGQDGAGTTCWPAPEQAANENMMQLGDLGLSAQDEDAIVAFLGTLSDGPEPGFAR